MPMKPRQGTYGMEHSEDYGGMRVAPDGSGKIEVGFSGHLSEHTAALKELLRNPDRFRVLEMGHSMTELKQIQAEIEAQGQVVEVGIGWQVVDVQLRPGEEERANSYFKRWDNAVVISMGNQTFVPPGCPQPRPPASCGDLEGSDPASAGIRLEVIPDSPTLLASDWGHAQLLVTNTGTSRFEIDSGIPIVGAVVTPHTEHIVGSNFGFIAGTGGGVNLAPGEHGTIEVVFGAARCDGQPGSALPPGTYGLRVRLTAEGLPDPNRPVYLSPEVPITITK